MKTFKDVQVGDIVHMSVRVERRSLTGNSILLQSTQNATQRLWIDGNFPVDSITEAPWVPAVGDKCQFYNKAVRIPRIYTILGINGNNWWLRDGDFYCSYIVDIAMVERVRE